MRQTLDNDSEIAVFSEKWQGIMEKKMAIIRLLQWPRTNLMAIIVSKVWKRYNDLLTLTDKGHSVIDSVPYF